MILPPVAFLILFKVSEEDWDGVGVSLSRPAAEELFRHIFVRWLSFEWGHHVVCIDLEVVYENAGGIYGGGEGVGGSEFPVDKEFDMVGSGRKGYYCGQYVAIRAKFCALAAII